MKKLVLATVALLASGCAAINNGVYQKITVSTEPANAICELSQEGVVFSILVGGETAYNVHRDMNPIVVTCSKKGFKETSVTLNPVTDNHGEVIVSFGFLDAAIGSNYSYPEDVFVSLAKRG